MLIFPGTGSQNVFFRYALHLERSISIHMDSQDGLRSSISRIPGSWRHWGPIIWNSFDGLEALGTTTVLFWWNIRFWGPKFENSVLDETTTNSKWPHLQFPCVQNSKSRKIQKLIEFPHFYPRLGWPICKNIWGMAHLDMVLKKKLISATPQHSPRHIIT